MGWGWVSLRFGSPNPTPQIPRGMKIYHRINAWHNGIPWHTYQRLIKLFFPQLAMLDCHRVSNVLVSSYFMLLNIMNYHWPRWLAMIWPFSDPPQHFTLKYRSIWKFPKMGVTLKSSIYRQIFHYKPSNWRYPPFMETLISSFVFLPRKVLGIS